MAEETETDLTGEVGTPETPRAPEPRLSDEQAEQAAPAGQAGQVRSGEAGQARDRARTAVLGAMGALAVLGVALIARGPRAAGQGEPLAIPAVLTSAALARDGGAAEGNGANGAGAADAAVAAPVVTHPAETPRPPPAWRVGALRSDPAIDVVEGHYGKRTVSAALTQAGLSRAEIKRITHAFEGVHRLEHRGAVAPKASFVLARSKAKGTVLAFEHVESPSHVWQASVDEASSDKRLVARRAELFVEHKRVATTLTVSADLGKAVTAAGLRDGALEAIDDALEGHVDLATIRSGVRLRVVADEEWVEGAYARFHVEALDLVPKTGAPLRVYYYERDPSTEGNKRRAPLPGYYDVKGHQPYRGAFRSPLPLARVTSRFNPRRLHPVLHVVMPHNGIDFGASSGTPVYASAPGTIASAGDGGPCGNMVQIDHAGGLTTAYCHLSRFAPGLHPGAHVEARQLVGYVGQTGRATGPHLHFAVKRGGAFIDPLALKMDGVRVLPAADRDAFAKKRAALDAALDAVALPAATASPDEHDDDPAEE